LTCITSGHFETSHLTQVQFTNLSGTVDEYSPAAKERKEARNRDGDNISSDRDKFGPGASGL
jgi:hypothetical protein